MACHNEFVSITVWAEMEREPQVPVDFSPNEQPCGGADKTADPSAPLRFGRDDKIECAGWGQHWLLMERTADPLRFALSG
jgi:hypothetical protein